MVSFEHDLAFTPFFASEPVPVIGFHLLTTALMYYSVPFPASSFPVYPALSFGTTTGSSPNNHLGLSSAMLLLCHRLSHIDASLASSYSAFFTVLQLGSTKEHSEGRSEPQPSTPVSSSRVDKHALVSSALSLPFIAACSTLLLAHSYLLSL